VRRRRRYEVVVEGLSGQAASQRSVIGEHRSEAEAREAAAHERKRLEVIYGEGASAWRIVVVRDDEVVAEERPAASPDHQTPEPEPDPEDVAPPPPTEREEWPDMDMSGPVPDWVINKVEESIARRRDRERGTPDEDAPADD
jgi:hypothetical protein